MGNDRMGKQNSKTHKTTSHIPPEDDETKEEAWKCQIPNCWKAGKTEANMVKHIEKAHKERTIRINRQKAHCPLCNEGYSSMATLLVHLQMEEIQMTWKPAACAMAHEKLIPWKLDALQEKRTLIQQHNKTGRTEEEKRQTVKNYMRKPNKKR